MGGSIGAGGLAQGGTEDMTWAVMGVTGGVGGWGGGTAGLPFLDITL